MESSRRRIFTIFSLVFLLLGVTGMNVTGAAMKAKVTAPGSPTNVKAVGGVNRATVSWKAPASNGGNGILWYRVIYYPGAVGYNCKGSVLSCIITIPNPNKPSAKPKPMSYYFTVTAINSIGSSPASARSSTVTVNFTGTVYIPPKFGPASPTPTPIPIPTSTLIPCGLSSTPLIKTYDGSYHGQAVVTINQGTTPITSTIPATFTILDGRGTGKADIWAINGCVTDAGGGATVVASNNLYGAITFAVKLSIDPVSHVMSASGTGVNSFSIPGAASVTVEFVFNVDNKE